MTPTEIELLQQIVANQQAQIEQLSIIAGFIACGVLAFGFCKLFPH